MNNLNKQRDVYVDVAKGIAMLLVVRIHTEVFGVINVPYPIISVPFFFFLSGFYDNTYKPVKDWLPNTFKRLFLVGIYWVIISFTYISLLHYLKDHTIPINVSVYQPLIGGRATWFLFALFYAKCGTWLINKTKIPSYIILPLLILFGGVISRINLPLLLDEGIAAIPFYYAGKVCYPLINKNRKIVSWLSVIGVICILLMQMRWFPWVLVSYTQHPPYMYPVFFLMTFCSFATFIWISKKLENQKWLGNFGKQTMGVLVLHPLLLHTIAVVLNRIFEKGSTPWIIIFLVAYVIVCVLSYYLSLLIMKYCPILLGGKKK